MDHRKWETLYAHIWYAIHCLVLLIGMFLFLNMVILNSYIWSVGILLDGLVFSVVMNIFSFQMCISAY